MDRPEPYQMEDDDGLPVPRLELRWTRIDCGEWVWFCEYNLVTLHLLGEYWATPMGGTKRGGARPPMRGEMVDVPFRDNAHIRHDAKQLNLPAFAIWGKKVTRLAEHIEGDYPWPERAKRDEEDA